LIFKIILKLADSDSWYLFLNDFCANYELIRPL
jgi:hypothetical protein